MGYLIDTNVISELIKVKQNIQVIEWFSKVRNQDLRVWFANRILSVDYHVAESAASKSN